MNLNHFNSLKTPRRVKEGVNGQTSVISLDILVKQGFDDGKDQKGDSVELTVDTDIIILGTSLPGCRSPGAQTPRHPYTSLGLTSKSYVLSETETVTLPVKGLLRNHTLERVNSR